MKSLILASALALGALAVDSYYYIANYSAGTTKKLIPYPLETCVPNGAFSFNYVVYHCSDFDSKVYSEVYESDDPYCESTYTVTSKVDIAVTNNGKYGYADCVGTRNYMEVLQYLGSCSNWENGKDPIAVTRIATDACTFQMVDSNTGYPIYARTNCDGDGQTTYVYVGDYTCQSPSALYQTLYTELGCSYYTSSSAGTVYSAMSRCVVNDNVDRCSMPISQYTSAVQVMGLTEDTDFTALYMRMFPYSGLSVSDLSGTHPNVNFTLDLTFCTEWEDRRYGPLVKDLGQQTINALNYDVTVCFNCVDSMCVNSTMCDESNCDMTHRCAPMVTTTMMTTESSVGAMHVGIATFLMTLLVFVF